jgi:DNA polymerase-3 subunit gamma/tau
MSIALARRYRPRRFADLLVQDHVTAVLRGAVAKGRVGHGYLLTGPRGVGKTTAARILAMALNCPNRDAAGDPCGECADCQRIWSGAANLDVVEIDAASNRGVEDARDLRERAMYAASQAGRHKVYIVDEAHMLTREAWNALLKILEEPPPGVVFVFATTEPQKIAAAAAPVMSRLQRFDFRRIGPSAIRDRLREVLEREGVEADDDALTLIARHADGGMRDALSQLDQCLSFGDGRVTAERVREVLGLVDDEIYGELLELVVARRPAGVFPLVERLMESGADLAEFVGGAADALRALLMVQVGAAPEGLTEAMRAALERYRDALEPGDVLRMLRLLADSEGAIRRSGNARLIVETLLLRWSMMDRIVDIEQVLAGTQAERPSERRSVERGAAPAAQPAAARPAAEAPRASPRAEPVGEAPARSSGPVRQADRPSWDEPDSAQASEPQEPPAPAGGVPFTVAGLKAAWRQIVAAVRAESMFLGESLAHTTPTEAAPPRLLVTLGEPNPLFGDRLEQQAQTVERIVAGFVGEPVRLQVSVAGAGGGGAAEAPRPKRLTQEGLKADRLKGIRAKDPSLDAAADELDLEIVD